MDSEEKKEQKREEAANPAPKQKFPIAPEEELAQTKEKLELVMRERDEYLDGWRRTKADLANYRNEELARLEEVVKFGNSDIAKELVPVLQNFDLAARSLGNDGAGRGVQMIKSQLEEVMKRRGLEEISVKAGDVYDPARQEILSEEESEKPPGTILEVAQKGYALHGKVICPAQVKVSRGNKQENQ